MGKSHSVKRPGAGNKGGSRDAHALARRLLHGQSRFKGAKGRKTHQGRGTSVTL